MKPIRGLVVDDDPDKIEMITRRLDRWFRKRGWELRWTREEDPDLGHDLIESQDPYALVVVDLMFPRTDLGDDVQEPLGLELIRSARDRSEASFVFAISNGDPGIVDLFEQAELAGANRVVRRQEFNDRSAVKHPKVIVDEICNYLLNNGTVVETRMEYDERDPGMQAIVHVVGDRILPRLYAEVLRKDGKRAGEMKAEFLAPGASGASVCRVRAPVEGVGTVNHVLKVSRDEGALRREAERGGLAGQVLTRWLVPHLTGGPVGPIKGWYALGSSLASRAVTMRAWLAAGPAPGLVEDVMQVLFTEALAPVYAESGKDARDALTMLAPREHRRYQIREALHGHREVMTWEDGCGLGGEVEELVEEVTDFVLDQRLPRVPSRLVPRETFRTYAHGDLHGGNVLVYDGRHPVPVLIDPSRFGMAHWAVDPARLAVDLIMRSVDAGVESMLFRGFDTWRNLVAAFASGDPDLTAVTSGDETKAAVAALSWLGGNLRKVCHVLADDAGFGKWRWEWHAALACQLLWASCHENLPPPKRALAMVAAHDQLKAAVEAL